ncbi:unnamed protein product, partial [Didymodactylos carnosus]
MFSNSVYFEISFHLLAESDGAKSFDWSGAKWIVKDGSGMGPGPNTWSSDNVWIDSENKLHMKIRNVNGVWSCAEAYTNDKFGFGSYEWHVEGEIDKYDTNIVLGFFTYGKTDGQDEIDIEIAKWGQITSEAKNLFYTVYPREKNQPKDSQGIQFHLSGTYTTHRFQWSSKNVALQSFHGFTDAKENEFFTYRTPDSYEQFVPMN